MAHTGRCFLVALGLSRFFFLAASSSSLLDDGSHCDALALVQQRAKLQPRSTSLARVLEDSFRTQPTAYEAIIDKVVHTAGEAKLNHFWKQVMEIGRAPNMTRAQRGLRLLQESARVMTNEGRDGDDDDDAERGWFDWLWESSLYESLTKEKSEPHSCIITRFSILLDIGDLAVSIAYPVGKKCDVDGLCLASALDIMRSLVYLAREITAGEFSYCDEKISASNLCGASSMGVFAEMMGVVHSSVSLKYKCDSNTYNPSAESKIFGKGARGVLCGWDITRGAAYTVAGIYRLYSFFYMRMDYGETFVNEDKSLWKPTKGEVESGQSGPAYGFLALGGFAWMANALTTVLTNCPDESREVAKKNPACTKEAFELVAYIFQTFGWAWNWRDYCMDKYDKNDRRRGSGDQGNTEQNFKKGVIDKMNSLPIKKQLTDVEERELFFGNTDGNEPNDEVNEDEIPVSGKKLSDLYPKAKEFGVAMVNEIEEELRNKDLLKVSGVDDPNANKLVQPEVSENQLGSSSVGNELNQIVIPEVVDTVDPSKVNPQTLDDSSNLRVDPNKVTPKTLDESSNVVVDPNKVTPKTLDDDSNENYLDVETAL